MASPGYHDIQAGAEIAPRQYQVTRRDLVRYAGASGDFNVIHWNERIAKSVGLPDVIAHGMLTMALAGRFLTEWAGDPAAVTEFGVRFSAPVVVPDDDKGALVEITGVVTGKLDGNQVTVDVTARSGDTKVLTRAHAVVRLPTVLPRGTTPWNPRRMRLADYTTVRLGGPARGFVRAGTEEELIEAVRAADAAGEPVLILGGGSNLVVSDEGFDGTVIQVATRGVSRDGGPGVLTVAAGEDWDAVVARSVAEGLAGLECLSGIPGLAGATPIQNVGAYGQEVSETITRVRVYDRVTGDVLEMPNGLCGFGYRTSRFRGADRFVVLSVTFDLAVQVLSAPVRYAELAAALGVPPGGQAESAEARAAVIELRQRKGMVIDPADPDTRSVGSFFVNPVLDAPALAAVEAAARARCGPGSRVPRFEVEGSGDGLVKVPAAWLIERAGFGKGYNPGDGARISAKHTLALVNAGSASTAALLALAREIRDGVRDAFGVSLTPEPVLVGVTL